MPAKPFSAIFSLIFRLIVMVPVAVERRQRLGGDVRTSPDAAVRLGCPLLGESRGKRDSEGGGEPDQNDYLERGMYLNAELFRCFRSPN